MGITNFIRSKAAHRSVRRTVFNVRQEGKTNRVDNAERSVSTGYRGGEIKAFSDSAKTLICFVTRPPTNAPRYLPPSHNASLGLSGRGIWYRFIFRRTLPITNIFCEIYYNILWDNDSIMQYA